jgi:hypothetical protein
MKVEDLGAWLKASPRSITTPIRNIVMPDTPDTVIVLSDYGGYPLENEDALDVPTFQVRARSEQPVVARDLIQQVDRYLVDSQRPFLLGSQHVITVGRVGGAPGYLETDDRNRTIYVCNYWLRIER